MKSKRNRYRNYISLQAIIILCVLASFRLLPDKKIASLIASALFIGASFFIIFYERGFVGYQKRLSYWGTVVFVVFSAIPIVLLRLFNWEQSFDLIVFWGFTGKQLHQMSNYIFILLLVGYFIDSYNENRSQNEHLSK